ncbi:uncharacterized protein LOC135383733 [Ornithodoros turicata]|uniref:uncharacterized protein LOC135383733 n=1 Tax=Ornithodoros turicata TaxID=34597 RepID=UPI003138B6DE
MPRSSTPVPGDESLMWDDDDLTTEIQDPHDTTYEPNQTDPNTTTDTSVFDNSLREHHEVDEVMAAGSSATDTLPNHDAGASEHSTRNERFKCTQGGSSGLRENMYMVSESCLLQLLRICPECLSPKTVTDFNCKGSCLRASITCKNGHTRIWYSQPSYGEKPIGNILMSAAILFSGCSPTKVLRMFQFLGLASIKKTQYFKLQQCYLFPAVHQAWKSEQASLLSTIKEKALSVAGDARCDSPGHCALMGTYTLLETTLNKILHFEQIMSPEVGSSNQMERTGLERALEYLEQQDMTIDMLITDRHTGVKAYMKTKTIKHRFDVWHVAKGIKKKISTAAQTKAHHVLGLWCESIIRHLYWCAKTSSDNGDELLAKWTSIMRHIIDIHTHPDPLHPTCFHGDLGERLWLQEGTETYMKLQSILLSKHLLADIPRLSPREQTYGLEAYHSLLIHFAPKCNSYTYEGMQARTEIAALHYNHNSARTIVKNDDGSDKYIFKGSKPKKQWVIIPQKESVSYGYIDKIFTELVKCLDKWPTFEDAERGNQRVTRPTLSSSYGEKPNMTEARRRHWSRFQVSAVAHEENECQT